MPRGRRLRREVKTLGTLDRRPREVGEEQHRLVVHDGEALRAGGRSFSTWQR